MLSMTRLMPDQGISHHNTESSTAAILDTQVPRSHAPQIGLYMYMQDTLWARAAP